MILGALCEGEKVDDVTKMLRLKQKNAHHTCIVCRGITGAGAIARQNSGLGTSSDAKREDSKSVWKAVMRRDTCEIKLEWRTR